MKTRQVNLRLESNLVSSIEAAAQVERLDRGSMVRKLLLEGLDKWRLDHVLRRYQSGEISIGRACEDSGVSHWEMLDLVQSRGIMRRIDIEDSIARAREVMRRRSSRVAEAAPVYRGASSRGRRDEGTTTTSSGRTASGEVTLPDLPPGPNGILLVGINPAPPSVARGHYYQGKLGRRLWKRLMSLGLLHDVVPGHEDEAFVAAGHGLTDVVKRPTRTADELESTELTEGAKVLRSKIREWSPKLVLFAFKGAAVAALGHRDIRPGRCGDIEGVPAFLLTGPYASGPDSGANDDDLRDLLD